MPIRPREAIEIIGVVTLVISALAGLSFGWVFALFVVIQIVAALDVILLGVGRFLPVATLWGISAENWLGPLPWHKK